MLQGHCPNYSWHGPQRPPTTTPCLQQRSVMTGQDGTDRFYQGEVMIIRYTSASASPSQMEISSAATAGVGSRIGGTPLRGTRSKSPARSAGHCAQSKRSHRIGPLPSKFVIL